MTTRTEAELRVVLPGIPPSVNHAYYHRSHADGRTTLREWVLYTGPRCGPMRSTWRGNSEDAFGERCRRQSGLRGGLQNDA